MDYHRSMKNYLNSKLILFKKILPKNSYIITDKNIPEFKKIKKIAQKKDLKNIIDSIDKEYDLSNFKLVGDFQKKNLIMAIKACTILGLSEKKIINCLDKLKNS